MLQPEPLVARPSFRTLKGTFTNGINYFKIVERHVMYDCSSRVLNNKLGWSPWHDSKARSEIDPGSSDLIFERGQRMIAMLARNPNREVVTVLRDPPHCCLGITWLL